MIPSLDDLADAQSAINKQCPALSVIAEGETGPFALTSRQAATIATALGVATYVAREGLAPTPVQVGWAAIIESALVARGAARFERDVLEALHRVDAPTLERMAEIVLEAGMWPKPDTPESVAAKCIAARAVGDAFRDGRHPASTFSPEVKPKGGALCDLDEPLGAILTTSDGPDAPLRDRRIGGAKREGAR